MKKRPQIANALTNKKTLKTGNSGFVKPTSFVVGNQPLIYLRNNLGCSFIKTKVFQFPLQLLAPIHTLHLIILLLKL